MNPKSIQKELSVGALLLTALAVLVYMAIQTGSIQVETDEIVATVHFDDAAGLTVGAGASVAGVEVGRVTSMQIDHNQAIIELALRESAGLRKDVLARVRARSLLGEKYVELVPQSRTEPVLINGDQITNTEGQYEIDMLLGQMGPLLDAAKPEQLTDTLEIVTSALVDDPERLERMLDDLEAMVRNLREASATAPQIAADAGAAAADAKRLMSDARPLISRVEQSLDKLDATLDPAQAAASKLPGLADQVELVLTDAEGLVAGLEGQTETIETVLTNLSEIDKWELRRLLREEGILVRMRARDVEETD